MFSQEDCYVFKNQDNELEVFIIRKLGKYDLEQIIRARKEQEIELGNGATQEYLDKYKDTIQILFDENNIVGAGAFKGDKLVSIALTNLIKYGSKEKIPYMCAGWTDPKFRRKNLAIEVYKKIMEGLFSRKDELQNKILLTIEGKEPVKKLCEKLEYKIVDGEMSFLGDIIDIDKNDYKETQEGVTTKVEYYKNGRASMQILYSNEQLFAHPSNLDGVMSRITSISALSEKLGKEEFISFLTTFLSEHRFCKFNVQELASKEKNLWKICGAKSNENNDIIEAFEQIKFDDKKGQIVHIERKNNVREKDLSKEFSNIDKNKNSLEK